MARWRLLAGGGSEVFEAENRGVFDELVLEEWLHPESMGENEWWLRIGDARLWVTRDAAGKVRVDVERGCYTEIHGDTKLSRDANPL